MAIKNLIVPGFIGTGTIEYIVNRGYEAAPVPTLDVIGTTRFDFNYDQYFITQLSDGNIKLNKGYQKYEVTEVLPAVTDVVASHSLLSSDQIAYQLGDGTLKFSKGIS
tara:strand:- start:1434 stop:1757 length:324 start_codon:yes stop_codon:yes gene_type:complete